MVDDRRDDGSAGRRAARAAQHLQPLEDDPAFAGLYIDGPGLVVLFTGEPTAVSTALLDPCPVPVLRRPAEHGMSRLTEAQSRLTAASQRLAAAGVELVSWGPDVAANALRVEVRRLTADGERLVREVVPGVRLLVEGLRAGPGHPPACDRHYPLGPLTLAGGACASCGVMTNSVFHLCPECSRRARTCVLCGAPAEHGVG